MSIPTTVQRSRFVRGVGGYDHSAPSAYWFVFVRDRLMLIRNGEDFQIATTTDLARLGLNLPQAALLGYLDEAPCYVTEIADVEGLPDVELVDLRRAYGLVPELEYGIVGYAAQVAQWDRTSLFCPVCATPTEVVAAERAKRCPACGYLQYPRVSPCIIVLIYRPGQVLLTRQSSWPPNMYSLVAGFVEAGESLEACLRREVAEEVGVSLAEIRYLGSQPWPFPHQLMTGFVARYASGDIRIDEQELEHAAWFDLDALPTLSSPMSISRRIIDWHVASQADPNLPFRGWD